MGWTESKVGMNQTHISVCNTYLSIQLLYGQPESEPQKKLSPSWFVRMSIRVDVQPPHGGLAHGPARQLGDRTLFYIAAQIDGCDEPFDSQSIGNVLFGLKGHGSSPGTEAVLLGKPGR